MTGCSSTFPCTTQYYPLPPSPGHRGNPDFWWGKQIHSSQLKFASTLLFFFYNSQSSGVDNMKRRIHYPSFRPPNFQLLLSGYRLPLFLYVWVCWHYSETLCRARYVNLIQPVRTCSFAETKSQNRDEGSLLKGVHFITWMELEGIVKRHEC